VQPRRASQKNAIPSALQEHSAAQRREPDGADAQRSGESLVGRHIVPMPQGERIVPMSLREDEWSLQEDNAMRFTVREGDSKEAGLSIARLRYPVEAVAFLDRSGLEGRVFATLVESSYLTAHGRPVFADPRGDVWDDEHFRRYVGEMVRATIVDSEDPERSHQLRGRLGQADEGGIELIAEDGTAHRIALAHVRRAHLDPDLDFRGEGGRARRGGGSNDGEAGRA